MRMERFVECYKSLTSEHFVLIDDNYGLARSLAPRISCAISSDHGFPNEEAAVSRRSWRPMSVLVNDFGGFPSVLRRCSIIGGGIGYEGPIFCLQQAGQVIDCVAVTPGQERITLEL